MIKSKLSARIYSVVSVLLAASGCSVVPGIDLSLQSSLIGAPSEIGGYELIPITPDVVSDLVYSETLKDRNSRLKVNGLANDNSTNYLVGPGDVLTIIVWDHPELTSPTGEFRDPVSSGRLVGADGKIYYPYIGELEVSGLTTSSIRRLVSSRLARVVRNPQVDVRVVAFRSQSVRVTGEVNSSTVVPITDRGVTVLDAIASAGGLKESASRRFVTLIRDRSEFHLDLHANPKDGVSDAELLLRDGDVLHVPNQDEYLIYMLGSVNIQSAITLPNGYMSLAEALSKANGLDQQAADRRKVFVIREQNNVAQSYAHGVPKGGISVYAMDMSNVSSFVLSHQFVLMPDDVVYVDRTGLATYNSVISQILPTISALFQLDRLISDR